jgi:hypothetical protein
MSLVRFDTPASRSPSGALWQGIADWVHGTLEADADGHRVFRDYSPMNTGDFAVAGTTGAAVTLEDRREGVVGSILLTADAGANAEAAIVWNIVTELDQIDNFAAFEWRVMRNDSADAQYTAIGLTDQLGGAILASNALATGGGQDFLGFRWNNDGTIDLVAVVAGTLTELVDTVATIVNGSATGFSKLGLKITRPTTTTYKLLPFINGVAMIAKDTVVASTAVPLVGMKPAIAIGTDATTAPSLSSDWFGFADK